MPRTRLNPDSPPRAAWRLFVGTAVLAVAGSLSLAALAAPPEGRGPGGLHEGHGMGAMGPRGLMGPGGARHVERMLDAVKATAEQRTQIQQILQAARTDLQAQHEAGRKLHDQGQALFVQPAVDARAAEAVRQQMLAQHDQATKRMMQALLDVSRVLSPEQRKTLADGMARRRAMMERHQQERQQMDRPPR